MWLWYSCSVFFSELFKKKIGEDWAVLQKRYFHVIKFSVLLIILHWWFESYGGSLRIWMTDLKSVYFSKHFKKKFGDDWMVLQKRYFHVIKFSVLLIISHWWFESYGGSLKISTTEYWSVYFSST